MSGWDALPGLAAWRLHDAHDGFEVAAIEERPDGVRFAGATVGVENGRPWDVRYRIVVDDAWVSRRIDIDRAGAVSVVEQDGGRWSVEGRPRPDLDGCLDLDVEGSLLTNLLAIRRLGLAVGEERAVSMVYVQTIEPRVRRDEQVYRRLGPREFEYRSGDAGYRARIGSDGSGLTRHYEGVGTRVI